MILLALVQNSMCILVRGLHLGICRPVRHHLHLEKRQEKVQIQVKREKSYGLALQACFGVMHIALIHGRLYKGVKYSESFELLAKRENDIKPGSKRELTAKSFHRPKDGRCDGGDLDLVQITVVLDRFPKLDNATKHSGKTCFYDCWNINFKFVNVRSNCLLKQVFEVPERKKSYCSRWSNKKVDPAQLSIVSCCLCSSQMCFNDSWSRNSKIHECSRDTISGYRVVLTEGRPNIDLFVTKRARKAFSCFRNCFRGLTSLFVWWIERPLTMTKFEVFSKHANNPFAGNGF